MARAQPAREQPQAAHDEERRHQDRALDEVRDGVHGHRVQREEAEREPSAGDS
jgi:hypothetical protein